MKGKSNSKKTVFKWLEKNANKIVVFLLVLLVLLPFIATRKARFDLYFDQESSWTGDAIGGITAPVIGLLSIFLIYLTYTSQKKEFKKLSKSSAIQNFESGFFYLLKNLENFGENLKPIYNKNGKTWVAYFNSRFNSSLASFNGNPFNYSQFPESTKESYVYKAFEDFCNLSTYNDYKRCFAKLYNLLSMIHFNNQLNDREKKHYIRIIQLSIKAEIWMQLFYYSLVSNSLNSEKPYSLKAVIQFYNFFEFIEIESLITREHVNFYPYITFNFLDENEKSEVIKKREDIELLKQYI